MKKIPYRGLYLNDCGSHKPQTLKSTFNYHHKRRLSKRRMSG